jgi:2-haloacid dehalogenase
MLIAPKELKVLLFDINETLLDLSPLHSRIDEFLGKPNASQLWFTRLLQYSLVMTVSQKYAPFNEIANATLKMLAKSFDAQAGEEDIKEALSAMSRLEPYPEVPKALALLKEKGYRLAALTNSSQTSLKSQLEHAGLSDFFEQQLSVDTVQKYKPHRELYQWAARAMDEEAQYCMLIAAHGWDVAGAKWAGMKTAFISRPGQQLFPLAEEPDLQLRDLMGLVNAL